MRHVENKNGGLVSGFKIFARGILDFRFQQYLSMQLLPFFYGLLLIGVFGLAVVINVLAFQFSSEAGYVTLLVSPLAVAIATAVVRATLEFLVMAYRIMATVQQMDRIPGQVDNLNSKVDHITEKVNQHDSSVGEIRGKVVEVSNTGGFLKPIATLGTLADRALKKRD